MLQYYRKADFNNACLVTALRAKKKELIYSKIN